VQSYGEDYQHGVGPCGCEVPRFPLKIIMH